MEPSQIPCTWVASEVPKVALANAPGWEPAEVTVCSTRGAFERTRCRGSLSNCLALHPMSRSRGDGRTRVRAREPTPHGDILESNATGGESRRRLTLMRVAFVVLALAVAVAAAATQWPAERNEPIRDGDPYRLGFTFGEEALNRQSFALAQFIVGSRPDHAQALAWCDDHLPTSAIRSYSETFEFARGCASGLGYP
jgi:hypothetical protein